MWISRITQILTGKPCKYYESQHDQLKTWSTRNPTNCAAITTRLWAGTHEQNVLQSLREAPALVNFKLDTDKTSQRDEPEMTSSRGSPKKGVGWNHHWRLNWNKRTWRKRRASETWTNRDLEKVTQGEKLSEEQPQCESGSRLETKLTALPHHFTKKTANSNAQTPHATHSGQTCKMIQPSHHPHWRRNMCFLMCPNMTWNTVPLGGDADSHTIQLTAPPSQHLIEQTRTTTGRRSVALSTLTLRWRRREMSQIWFGHAALRQKVLDEPIVDVSTSSKQSSKQTKKQTRMWPKKLFREIPSDEKLDQQQSEIWNLIGWTVTPLDQQENVTTSRHFM